MNYLNINKLEEKIFGRKSRFALNKRQENELSRSFKNSIILIAGAAGSIGKAFSLKLKKYKIKKLIFLDKNENSLTELNREVNLLFKNNISREYICHDINDLSLKNILRNSKVNHFFNFAALKHVRSEENIHSLAYLFKTNCISPFKMGSLKNMKSLKKVFFISTDKAAYPSSLMGCSKKIMENELYNIKKKYKSKFVSTVRFANVSFSNGSLLENIYKKTISNLPFGIPNSIKIYFVTHSEAADLCFISLLNEANNSIIIPSHKTVGKQIYLKELAVKIVRLLKKKPIFVKKIQKMNNNFQQIILETGDIKGQKNREFFYEDKEMIKNFNGDIRVKKISLYQNTNSKKYKLFLKKPRNLNDYLSFFGKIFANKYFSTKDKNKIYLKNII